MRRLNFSLVLSLVACSVLCAQNTPNSYRLNQIATPWRGGAFADFNGDGALDYAALCFNNQSLKYQLNIFLGRGDGASGSATSATINVGQTATYNLAVTPAGGFTGTLAVSCTGAPAGMQCTGNPASLTISGANPVSVTFTVGPMASAENTLPFKGSSAALALALFFGLISASFRRAGLRLRRFSITIVACALLLAGLSCGGGSSNPAPTPVQSSTTYVLNAILTAASGQQVNQSLVLTVLGSAK